MKVLRTDVSESDEQCLGEDELLMRNIFDQYTHPENRLSHALASCLYEDRDLLKGFLKWVGVDPPIASKALEIVEQTLPGDPPEAEEVAERRGLPDIVIHDGEGWCLLLESKVMAGLTDDQLTRHERTLRRRGFEQLTRVVLTLDGVRAQHAIALTWSRLYEWLGTTQQRNVWAQRLRSYLRAAEVRLAREGYLTEGTLTMFDGFQFSPDDPYTYGEGKRLLKLAMSELRKDAALRRLGVNPLAKGRTAITGRGGSAVWDFLSLADRPADGAFTRYPHLTLAIHADHLEVAITIPNDVVRIVRERLVKLGVGGLVEVNAEILKRAHRIVSLGGTVQAYAVQRHYATQRSNATIDAKMFFKLDTSQVRRIGKVKPQHQWVELFAELLEKKRSNIQFAYVVQLPWGTSGLDRRESLKLIVESWCAMEPLLSAIRSPN